MKTGESLLRKGFRTQLRGLTGNSSSHKGSNYKKCVYYISNMNDCSLGRWIQVSLTDIFHHRSTFSHRTKESRKELVALFEKVEELEEGCHRGSLDSL